MWGGLWAKAGLEEAGRSAGSRVGPGAEGHEEQAVGSPTPPCTLSHSFSETEDLTSTGSEGLPCVMGLKQLSDPPTPARTGRD